MIAHSKELEKLSRSRGGGNSLKDLLKSYGVVKIEKVKGPPYGSKLENFFEFFSVIL